MFHGLAFKFVLYLDWEVSISFCDEDKMIVMSATEAAWQTKYTTRTSLG